MDTKLTLKLDKQVIEHAKRYATMHKRSLSGIVESYLSTLTAPESDIPEVRDDISPFVKSMKSGVQVPTSLDEKETYGTYRADKYK